MGDQRRIFLAQFLPDSSTKFVSCGVKHVRFWNLVGTQLVNKKGHIPKSLDASMQTMLSLAFAPVSSHTLEVRDSRARIEARRPAPFQPQAFASISLYLISSLLDFEQRVSHELYENRRFRVLTYFPSL